MKTLKNLREEKKLTQKNMAKIFNITTSYYGYIENSMRMPSLPLAIKISHFFEISVEEFFLIITTTKSCEKEKNTT